MQKNKGNNRSETTSRKRNTNSKIEMHPEINLHSGDFGFSNQIKDKD